MAALSATLTVLFRLGVRAARAAVHRESGLQNGHAWAQWRSPGRPTGFPGPSTTRELNLGSQAFEIFLNDCGRCFEAAA